MLVLDSARKWLRCRRMRVLSYDAVSHYQKIVKILAKTDLIMGRSICRWSNWEQTLKRA